MTSKTHVALGLLTGIYLLQNNPALDIYTVMTATAIGSLMPDLDTKHSDPAQIFPPIAWIVDKLTKHRGFTHTMFPLLLIIGHYYYHNQILLYLGIGALTHLIIDVVTLKLGIPCNSGGERTIFILLWLIILFMILKHVWIEYHLIKYIPKETISKFDKLLNGEFNKMMYKWNARH
jgi:uncharacterized metal-binding protein